MAEPERKRALGSLRRISGLIDQAQDDAAMWFTSIELHVQLALAKRLINNAITTAQADSEAQGNRPEGAVEERCAECGHALAEHAYLDEVWICDNPACEDRIECCVTVASQSRSKPSCSTSVSTSDAEVVRRNSGGITGSIVRFVGAIGSSSRKTS